jgi:alpha-maltose-1-phosphate synthase
MAESTSRAVALIRGNALTPWEGSAWENLGNPFSVLGVCGRGNPYDISSLTFPVHRLSCTADNAFAHRAFFYGLGVSEQMSGLELFLQKNNIAIAHTAELYHAYTLQAVRAKKRLPDMRVVATVWDNSFGRFDWTFAGEARVPPGFWRAAMHKRIQEVARGVDMFLPVSEESEALLSFYGVPASRMRVVSPGIRACVPDSAARDKTEKILHIHGKRYTLNVSRLVWEKGVYDTLAAWRMYVTTRGSRATDVLVFVGSGPARSRLATLAAEWGIAGTVHFASLDNSAVRQLCFGAHALILGSTATPVWQEQFGYVLAEAMSVGCPVITTHSGSIPGVVGDAALLVSALRPEKIAAALFDVQSASLRESCAQKGVAQSARFSTEAFRASLRDVYMSL